MRWLDSITDSMDMLRRKCQKLKAFQIPQQPYSMQLNWLLVIEKLTFFNPVKSQIFYLPTSLFIMYFPHVGFYYFINLPISLDISSLNMLDWASDFNLPNLYMQRQTGIHAMKNQFHWNIKQAGILSIQFELWCSLGDLVRTELLLFQKDAFHWLTKFKICLWERHTH